MPPRQPKKNQKLNKKEQARLAALTWHEEEARQNGFKSIAGVDEAGRGPLAGPVFAAACIIPEGVFFKGINDSKLLTAEEREDLYQRIISQEGIRFGIGVVSSEEIDKVNILRASILAMLQAIGNLGCQPDFMLVDGLHIPHQHIQCKKLIKGDSRSQSIAAASVLAKVSRDRLMEDYHQRWPEYGFDRNKGYGTEDHLSALHKFGPCPIHRKTFDPVKELLPSTSNQYMFTF